MWVYGQLPSLGMIVPFLTGIPADCWHTVHSTDEPNQVEIAVQSLLFWLSVGTLSCRCQFFVVSVLLIVFVAIFG